MVTASTAAGPDSRPAFLLQGLACYPKDQRSTVVEEEARGHVFAEGRKPLMLVLGLRVLALWTKSKSCLTGRGS